MSKTFLIDDNPEEGIIKNETLCSHERIEFSKLNQFPYCLIGKISSEFKSEKICKSGVGMLIGPSIVLTAGHNLTNINKQTGILQKTDNISFNLGISGNFEPFEVISTTDFHIPDEFIEGVKDQNAKMQLLNDWAVIYLPNPIGNTLKNLYNLENFAYLSVRENGLFSFFIDNINQNISKLVSLSPEISIIGYSESSSSDLNTNQLESKIEDTHSLKNDNDTINKKDININIQISTREEGLVKSSILKNNSTNNISMRLDQSDYVSNERKKSIEFLILKNRSNSIISPQENEDTKGKYFMTESKGNLDNFEDALKYKISTYKGQSGSPIFLKLKKIKSSCVKSDTSSVENEGKNLFIENLDIEQNSNLNNEFIYIFIGIHSRRGPLLYDSLLLKDDDLYFNKDFNNQIMLPIVEDEGDKVETATRRLKSLSICSKDHNMKVNEDSKQNIVNLVMVNGLCDFNEGLLLIGKKVNHICDAVKVSKNVPSLKSIINFTSYKTVTICLNGKDKIIGLFHKNSKLITLFDFGSTILSIDREYIILILNNKKHEKKFNSKYDNTKTLGQVLDDDEYSAKFNIEINMRYGDELGNKVLNKYMEIYDITIDQIKHNFKTDHMKSLYDSIFDEISMFAEIGCIYGKLFSKIKGFIMNKLEFSN